MACNIIRGSDGTNTVVDANGNPSVLYDDLIQLLNEYPYVTSELIPTDNVSNLAFQYYNLSNTPEFRSKYNLTSNLDVEVSIDDIIDHIKTEYSFNETQQAQQAYSNYLESLNKPNTNPELQGNQQITPVYSAVFFNTDEVISKYKPVHPNIFSHHSTIEFKPSDVSNLPIGEDKNIKIVGRLTTDKVDVLIVENPLSKNKFPHITLSTAEEIKPFASNSEIENNQDKIKPINDTIKGTIGVFDGKNEITTNTQQEQLKKFAELQERLNNKEFIEGAKFAYESSEGGKADYLKDNKITGSYNNEQLFNEFANLKGYNIKDVLNLVKSKSKDIVLNNIIDILIDNSSKIDSIFKFNGVEKFSWSKTALARFNPKEGIIALNNNAKNIWSEKEILEGIVHEYIHAYTVKAIVSRKTESEKQFYNDIVKIFKELKDNTNYSKEYGFSSVEEFISEISTNSEFREKLKYSKRSFLNKIIDAIKKLFGINSSNISNKNIENIDKALSVILNFIPNSSPSLASYGNNYYQEKNNQQSQSLKDIGTQEQYNDYIARVELGIIPKSKNDIQGFKEFVSSNVIPEQVEPTYNPETKSKNNIEILKERLPKTINLTTPQEFADYGYTLKSNYADEIGTILRSFANNDISDEEFSDRLLGIIEEQELTSDERVDKMRVGELKSLALTIKYRNLILANKENILKNILKKQSSKKFELRKVNDRENSFVIDTDYGGAGIGFNPITNEIWENDNKSTLVINNQQSQSLKASDKIVFGHPKVETVSNFGVNTKIDIPTVDRLSTEDKRSELDILLNAINKLKRDKIYSDKTISTITQMMRDIGFNMGSFEDIVTKSKRPYLKKENAIVDITAKMIHVSEGGSVSDLLEEIGHIVSAQLDGVDFEKALEIIKNDSKYTADMEKYISMYQAEEQYTGEDAIDKAATEILGQLIGEQLGNKLEENTNETLVGLIKRFIKKVLGMFKNQFDLHTYVSQSVDYFIKTPNRPFKRETYYYSLEEQRNEIKDIVVNLKQQRSKVLQLKSRFDKTAKGLLFKSDERKNVLDKQITFLTQEIMNSNTDRNVLDYLNEVLNDTNDIVAWLSLNYRKVIKQPYKVDNIKEEMIQFISVPNTNSDFNIANVSIRALSDARDYVHNYTYASTILSKMVSNNPRLTDGQKIELSTYITNIDSRLTFIANEVENLDKLKSQELIESLVVETGASYDYESLPKSVKKTLENYEQTKDINSAEVWFGPMGMVNSTLSRLVDGVFNLIYNNARIKTIDFSNTFLEKFKSYIGRDMSFVAETYNGKRTGDFIDEYHWGQWNIARKNKMKELSKDSKYDFPKDTFDRGEEMDSIKVYNDYKKDLNKKLKELQEELNDSGKLSRKSKSLQESIKKIEDLIKHYDKRSDVMDEYLEQVSNWYNTNTQPRHNADEIINHYRTILSPDDFNIWYSRSVILNSKNVVMYYKGELVQPSNVWINKDFNRLNAEQKRVIAELKSYKKEFDDMIGLPTNTLMPQMYQSMLNSLYDGKLSNIGTNIKGQFKRAFTRTSDDTQFEPEQEMRHFQEDNRVVGYIGSRYTKRLNTPEYISTDILGSMIGYAQMTYEFKEKIQRFDQFELIAQKMKRTKFANTSNKITSNSLEKLTNHLETHLMGKEEKPIELKIAPNVSINLNKVVSNFNKWISHSNLALGFITQTANIITSNINGVLEVILGQHVNTKSTTFALKEFTKLFTGETIKEFGTTIKTNKLDLMLRYFGLSESADATFNNLDKHIMTRKPIGTIAYAGYEAGAFYINSIALISILSNNRFYDGKLYTEQRFKDLNNNISFDSLPSAYDSIVIKNGKLELLGLKPSELNLLINKVRDLSKKLDGKLTKEDYAMAHTNIIGMSALIHRNWIIDGVFRRCKANGLNFKTGEMDEGYWVTTKDLIGKFLFSPDKLKILANLYANYKNLSREQRLGLNRTLLDLASIAVMIAVAGFIFNGGDDDEDDTQLLAYLSNRVLLEVSSFYNPLEVIYAVTDPIVSARQIETLLHFGKAFDFTEIERGKWEGSTNAEKYWYSLIPGVKGVMQTQDTESSNQFLKNKQLTWLY